MDLGMEDNLFGERVVSDRARARLKKKLRQGQLFETDLTPDEQRARKLAQDHRDEGGKELFPETPDSPDLSHPAS